MKAVSLFAVGFLLVGRTLAMMLMPSTADTEFERLALQYVNEFPALSPASATSLGDHRFDGELNWVSEEAQARRAAFLSEIPGAVGPPSSETASPARTRWTQRFWSRTCAAELWRLEELQEWAWNPLSYTHLTGVALYGLLARDFAPLPERLGHV